MSDGWPGDELREEAGKLVDEARKKDERIRQLEQDLEESQRFHQFAVENCLKLKEDIRFLLKCIVGDPSEGMGLERDDPARVHFRARLDGIRKKVT